MIWFQFIFLMFNKQMDNKYFPVQFVNFHDQDKGMYNVKW